MAKRPPQDWTQFTLGIYVKSSPDELFRMLATGHGLSQWFVRSAEFAPSPGPENRKRKTATPFPTAGTRSDGELCQAKDRYRWEWYYDGGIAGEGWILQVRQPSRVQFTFGDQMQVDISVRKHGAWCDVGLRQFGIPDTLQGRWDLHMGCRVAWAFFLTNLKSVAEKGNDLRETDRARSRKLHLVNI